METVEAPANITFHEDSKDVELIKWPGIVIVGKSVSPQQAGSILIRTDAFLPNFRYSTNSERLEEKLNALFGLTKDVVEADDYWDRLQDLRVRLGKLQLEYMSNACICSSYIGGPGGWCDWRGEIKRAGHNIGKWPCVGHVAAEWGEIANAFPYLNLKCWLFNHESGYPENLADPGAIVRFEIANAKVEVFETDPTKEVVPHVAGGTDLRSSVLAVALIPAHERESGIALEDLRKKLIEVYGEDYPRY